MTFSTSLAVPKNMMALSVTRLPCSRFLFFNATHCLDPFPKGTPFSFHVGYGMHPISTGNGQEP
jgi:hypothetical protein